MARTPDTVTWEGTLALATVTAGAATVSDSAASSPPRSGPIIPTVYHSDVASIRAGSDAMVTLTGASFTNTMGAMLYESDVALTAADGSSVTLTPDIILDEGTLVVTIPGDTPPGNYNVQAVKDEFASNPVVISIVPEVAITQGRRQPGTDDPLPAAGLAVTPLGSGTTVTGTYVQRIGRRCAHQDDGSHDYFVE